MRLRLRKLGYYTRALGDLMRVAERRTQLLARVLQPQGEFRMREGTVLWISERIDLLLLKETACDDVYGLGALNAPQVIVDIGAGFGDFAVLAARRFPACRVIACEPHPEQYALLRRNVAANGLRNVEIHRVALGHEERPMLSLSTPKALSSTRAHGPDGPVLPVDGRPLESLLPREVDLLKIDCEGGEMEVLTSASRSTLRRVNRVVAEYHTIDGRSLDEPMTRLLRSVGFHTVTLPDRFDEDRGYVIATRRG
jgi:FkbM family methyltransferase